MWTLNRHLTNTMIEHDTAAMFDFLATDAAARPGKLGIVGYCMSGRFVYRVAGAFAPSTITTSRTRRSSRFER